MTWDELRGEAFVELGLKPDEFYDMEREDYFNIYQNGYEKKLLIYYRMLRWAITPVVSVWSDKFNPFVNMKLKGDDELRLIIKNRHKDVETEAMKILELFKTDPDVNMNKVNEFMKSQKSKSN